MPPVSATTKAIGLILTATLGIVLMNTCAKLVSPGHNAVEMVFYRGLMALALLVPYMAATRPLSVFTTRRLGAHLYRSLVGNLGVGFVFWAYTLMPMADTTALLFAAPLFVTALSPLLLKEKIGATRGLAVLVGFGGVLLIVRPSPALLSQPGALIGLAAALMMALVDMALRNLGRTDDPLTTVFFFILIGVVVSGVYTLLWGSWPRGAHLGILAAMGIFTAIQQVAKTTAYRHAEASFLAPYTYSAIIWATLTGWLFWREWPSLSVVLGTIVIIASNLFLGWREPAPSGTRQWR
ncbi:MAG: DMT family transporter [Desulfosarcinaceae bacterium]|nr:DMT family transporter [Desulfosarcinaceae bacterium]